MHDYPAKLTLFSEGQYLARNPAFPSIRVFGDSPEDADQAWNALIGYIVLLYQEEGWTLPTAPTDSPASPH